MMTGCPVERVSLAMADGENLQLVTDDFFPVVEGVGEATEQSSSHIVFNHWPTERELTEFGDGFVHRRNKVCTQSCTLDFVILCRSGEFPFRFRMQDDLLIEPGAARPGRRLAPARRDG